MKALSRPVDAARRDPEALVGGKAPVTIDEVQREPGLLAACLLMDQLVNQTELARQVADSGRCSRRAGDRQRLSPTWGGSRAFATATWFSVWKRSGFAVKHWAGIEPDEFLK